MVVIEGADRVGKTTLARAIVRELNSLGWPHVYQHLGKPPESWRREAVSMHARLMWPYVVRDRLFMSEPVYASLSKDRSSMLSMSDVSLLNGLVKGNCGHTVVVAADEGTLRDRLTHRSDELYDVEQVLAANRAFTEIAETSAWAGHHFTVDASETHLNGWPDLNKCGLRSYTLRLRRMFPYHDARVWGGA